MEIPCKEEFGQENSQKVSNLAAKLVNAGLSHAEKSNTDSIDNISKGALDKKQNMTEKDEMTLEIKDHDASSSTTDKVEGAKKNPFTHYYAQLLHQQNMMHDSVRTGTYQRAFLSNKEDFRDKIVLDVGTGSGILAFFALQAGAKKVYAVEASNMAHYAKQLVQANKCDDKIIVLQGKIEDLSPPEKVDIIVSEPIGFLLVHERMLETYVVARQKWLKPEGRMFPSTGTIVLSAFTDNALYDEQCNKGQFWQNKDFFGVDISSLYSASQKEYLSQAVVGNFSSQCLLSQDKAYHKINFETTSLEAMQNFEIPFEFVIDYTGLMHGIAGWFNIDFIGSKRTVVLSTGPDDPCTHWYQCRMLFTEPLAVNRSQVVRGTCKFNANESFSYFITLECHLVGTDITATADINLQDQMYHYLQTGGYH